MNKADYEFLTLMHELVEWYLAQKRGIKEKNITKFDVSHSDLEEPGNSRNVPCHKEHMASMTVEILLAKELKVGMKEY